MVCGVCVCVWSVGSVFMHVVCVSLHLCLYVECMYVCVYGMCVVCARGVIHVYVVCVCVCICVCIWCVCVSLCVVCRWGVCECVWCVYLYV